jgi:ribosome biogenesis protein NSA1
VVRHPTLPIIASCGLDRYLRIHHSKTRQLLASVFLKQQLVSMVFDMSALPQEPVKTDATVPQEKSAFDDGRDDLDNSILHKVKSSKERKHTTFTESTSLGVSKKPRKSKSSELQDY